MIMCLAALWLSSCASLQTAPPKPNLSPWPEMRPDFRLEVLKARLQEYAVTFGAEVDLAAASIVRRTNDVNIQRNALTWRLRSVPEMRKACFRPEPVPALLDAWTLARQMEALFTTGAAANAFGPFQKEVVDVSSRLVAGVRDIGVYIAVSPDARDRIERDLVGSWAAAHPLRDLAFSRESAIAQFAEQMRERGEVFQSVGTIEDMLISLTHQVRIYLGDLPRQVRGEIDLLRSDALPPAHGGSRAARSRPGRRSGGSRRPYRRADARARARRAPGCARRSHETARPADAGVREGAGAGIGRFVDDDGGSSAKWR